MTDERQQLLNLVAGLAELESRAQECPIASYRPHPGQHEGHDSMAPIVVIMAGNRFGKTHWNVASAISASLGYRPWEVPDFRLIQRGDEWDFPPRDQIPVHAWVRRVDGLPIRLPNKIVVVSGLSLARGIGEIVQEKWAALWPKQVRFKTYLGPLGVWQKIVLPNGSEVYFGSATQSTMSWEGFSSDLVVADEPIPKRIFTALRRGLIDRKGQFLWSLTPLGDASIAWIAADLIESERVDAHIIRGTSWNNPYLDKEALRNFLDDPTLTADERRARETGELMALGRRIVTTFTDQCIIPPTDLPSDVPRLLVVDPHHARPAVLLWIAVLDDGERLVVYREYPEENYQKLRNPATTLTDLAGIIKTLEGKENVQWRVVDPSFGRQHARVHGEQFRSFVEEMAQHKLYFDERTDNDLDRGIITLRDAFRISPTTRLPRVQIMRNCTNLIKALRFWSYEERPDGTLKISESFKDHCDALRYALMYDIPLGMDASYSYIDEDDDEED